MLDKVWRKGTLPHCWWDCKLVQALWRTAWRFLRNLNTDPPHDPATPLLGMYPDKALLEKDTRSPMFPAALVTIAKTRKQPKRPSTDEWIQKMWEVLPSWLSRDQSDSHP